MKSTLILLILRFSATLCQPDPSIDPGVIAPRPARPEKSFLEQMFFDGVDAFAKTIDQYPKKILDIVPFPGVAAYHTDESQFTPEQIELSHGELHDLDVYDAPIKVRAKRAIKKKLKFVWNFFTSPIKALTGKFRGKRSALEENLDGGAPKKSRGKRFALKKKVKSVWNFFTSPIKALTSKFRGKRSTLEENFYGGARGKRFALKQKFDVARNLFTFPVRALSGILGGNGAPGNFLDIFPFPETAPIPEYDENRVFFEELMGIEDYNSAVAYDKANFAPVTQRVNSGPFPSRVRDFNRGFSRFRDSNSFSTRFSDSGTTSSLGFSDSGTTSSSGFSDSGTTSSSGFSDSGTFGGEDGGVTDSFK